MAKHDYATNLFNRDCSTYGTIASNGRARIERSGDGRIYVVVDGVKYSANRNDLFGINENPTAWLDCFLAELDKENKKNDFNANLQKHVDELEAKMEANSAEAKESHTLQESIMKAIHAASKAFRNFLAELGVSSRFSLNGEDRAKADSLNNDYWAQRAFYTKESNHEFSLLTENCILVSDQGKLKNEIAFNNVMLER